MKKTLIAILLAVALVVVPVSGALAATTADVTVNATPGWVSITNAPPSYDFGVILASSTDNTGTSYFTITNDSTVAMDIDIGCDGWSPVVGTNSWTYGAAGADQAQLNASDGDGAYDVTVPSGSSTQLMDAVATTTDPTWELELEAPSSFTFVDEQTTTVTLTAAPD